MTNETKEKIRKTLQDKYKNGELKLFWTGEKRDSKWHENQTKSKKGKRYSKNTEFQKGQKPWNKGKKGLQNGWSKGQTKETNSSVKKISNSRKGQAVIWGETHWNWQGGKSFELYPIEFKRAKKIIRILYKETCQLCGEKGKDIHHVDYDKQNNNFSNLVCLCRSCHIKTNYDRETWKKFFIKKKIILVTGSEGMIAKELIELLQKREPKSLIRYADLSLGLDLRFYELCLNLTNGVSEVYSLVGIKGSPKKTKEKPASFFVPMLQFNTNLLEAARVNKVKKFLYTSSIAVLNPQTDLFPSYAKKAGEMQIDAYKIEYPEFGNNCFIVRPANVYGKYDNFYNKESMVVTSLIRKALTEDEIEVWGDGSELREFISAKDVANGMILTMKKKPSLPINLGGGEMHSIKELVEIISEISGKKIKYLVSEQKGDKKRVVFEDKNQGDIGFKTSDSFKESVIETYEYMKQKFIEDNKQC